MTQTKQSSFWDTRYTESFASYGDEPNDFVRAVAGQIPLGPVLVIAAGEGRDAVYLAQRNYDVTAMDQSSVGLRNASALARERGVHIATVTANLAAFDFGEACWAGIVSIWAHVPTELRRQVHAACVRSLQPGGVFVFEAYAPEQLDAPGKGGPPNVELLVTPAVVRAELEGLHFELCQEVRREVNEGVYHTGLSVTTQVLARKHLV